MPPRRRTFYLADATILSNSKIRRISRENPDDWLAAWGAFHVLIGVATLNGNPKLSGDDILDTIGPENQRLVKLLRAAGLLGRSGIDPDTFAEWCPKPRPRYPSDDRGGQSDSGGVSSDSAVVGSNSAPTPAESPTSTTSSSSVSTTRAASSSRGVDSTKDDARPLAPKGAGAVDAELPIHLRAVQ